MRLWVATLFPKGKGCMANIRIALSKFEAVCPDRWSAASQNWVTQRFKKDTFIKDRNFLKLPNSCNPLTSFEVKKAMFITLISFLASISLNFDLNFLYFSIEIKWNNRQIQFPIEKTFQMRYWRSWMTFFNANHKVWFSRIFLNRWFW